MPRTRRNQSPEGENFDLDNVSGSDSDAEGPPTPAQGPTINPVPQVVNNPELTSTKKNAARDVWYFFVKNASGSVCQYCKYVAQSYLLSHLMCAQEDTRRQPQRLAWHRLPV